MSIVEEGVLKKWDYILILAIADLIALLFADQTSILSYGYTLLLLTASSWALCKKQAKDLFFAYHFYLFFAILFFMIFKSQFPAYLGMTGPEGGIGTDDCRFYAQIVDGNVPYSVLISTIELLPYSLFLKIMYPFTVSTPLNIVTASLIFTAYLPIYTKRLTNLFTLDSKMGSFAFWYSLICPFTLYFGCIILRESFTALMVVAGMYFFLKKKYITLAICITALAWIRFGTLAFLICGIILLYRYQLKRKTHTDFYFFIVIIAVIMAFYFSYSYLQVFSDGKLEDSLIRSTDNERYEDSTIGALMRLPFPINIILSTLFFLFIPLLSFPQPQYGHYLIGFVFQGFLTPLFMFFLWKYIFNASLSAFWGENRITAKKTLLITVLFALLLGTISMQSRHKTVLFPFICILAAYGKVNYNKDFNGFSIILTSLVIGIQLVMAIVTLF